MDLCPLYADPALYDSLFPEAGASGSVISVYDDARRARHVASTQFYIDEAKRAGGRVLEMACGSGRLTIPIAQAGVPVMGADLSRSMLDAARAKARAARLEMPFVEADMRSFDLPGPFAAILIPGNSLLHLLTLEDQKQCLACVKRHLAPGGRLVFDVSKWDLRLLTSDAAAERHEVLRVNDPVQGAITIEESASYDAAEQVRHLKWYLSSTSAPDFRVIEYQLRVIFPQELLLLLDAAGFRLEARYGEFPREPFASESPRQVCVCLCQ